MCDVLKQTEGHVRGKVTKTGFYSIEYKTSFEDKYR